VLCFIVLVQRRTVSGVLIRGSIALVVLGTCVECRGCCVRTFRSIRYCVRTERVAREVVALCQPDGLLSELKSLSISLTLVLYKLDLGRSFWSHLFINMYLATVGLDFSIQLRSVNDNYSVVRTLAEGHTCNIRSIHFSRDDERLLSSGDDGNVIYWNTTNGAELVRILIECPVLSSSLDDENGRALVRAYDDTISLWDLRRGEELFSIINPVVDYSVIDFLPGRTRFISSTSANLDLEDKTSMECSIVVWDSSTGAQLSIVDTKPHRINHMAVSPRSNWVAICGKNEAHVVILDFVSGDVVGMLRGHTASIGGFCFDRTGERLVTGSFDKTIRVWSMTSMATIMLIPCVDMVVSVALDADNNRVACGLHGERVCVFDLSMGNPLTSIEGTNSFCVRFSHPHVVLM
jgi:WD40 repeat protein